jgi:hypothetical protein
LSDDVASGFQTREPPLELVVREDGMLMKSPTSRITFVSAGLPA